MAKFAKLVWLAAVQLFYFCLIFSHIIQTKKREKEKGPIAIFERNDQNQCMF